MIARYGLGAFEFSQNYCFFWDQLEKANLFLQTARLLLVGDAFRRYPMRKIGVDFALIRLVDDQLANIVVADRIAHRMIARYGLGAFEFSQNYCFFWDQLEKANLFLQGVIDTRDAPREDRTVEWLFKNPLSDGGQFTGVADIVSKYGLVPKEAMPETRAASIPPRWPPC